MVGKNIKNKNRLFEIMGIVDPTFNKNILNENTKNDDIDFLEYLEIYKNELYNISQEDEEEGNFKKPNPNQIKKLRKVGKTFFVDDKNNIYSTTNERINLNNDIYDLVLLFPHQKFLPTKIKRFNLKNENSPDIIGDSNYYYAISLDDDYDVVGVWHKEGDTIIGKNLTMSDDGVEYLGKLVLPNNMLNLNVGSTVGSYQRPEGKEFIGIDGHKYSVSFFHDGSIMMINRE